jgi:hypothetical protein
MPAEATQLKQLVLCPVRQVVDSSTPRMTFGMRIVSFDLCDTLCKQALSHLMLLTANCITPEKLISVLCEMGRHATHTFQSL